MTSIPLWRDVRVLRVVAQLIFLAIMLLLAVSLCNNLTRGLQKFTNFDFDFLRSTSSLPLSESPIPYEPHDPMYRAYLVGLLNTVRVIVLGIILTSIVGLMVGVARLSANWLIAKIAHAYVEIFVDTPLLIQLYFWYLAGVLRLPRVRESLQLPGNIFLSNRGLAMPWYDPNANFEMWLWLIGAGFLLAIFFYVRLGKLKTRRAIREWRAVWAPLAFILIVILTANALNPFAVTIPELKGFNFQGGITLSPEYVALLLGLVLYTGAFVAEIVRAGIQAVPRGLSEAARALGLSYFQTLRLVTVPVALRVIIPPLTNQYLNLTKNSSLAIAVAYPDLFFVGGGIFNMTGQTIQVIGMMMGTYLLMSLAISAIMNLLNSRFKLVER